uniref:BPM/SPOP BACK domain-containing protein n=1 Tax=Arundo donax TaxID=35708 RepID=A0A0A9H9B9_ARUDO
MYQHLLVAADRCSVERLKFICEDKLCKCNDVGNVTTVMALAEQHHCPVLKKMCLNFLSAPANLRAIMASDVFERLSRSCPSIKKDLVAMLAS